MENSNSEMSVFKIINSIQEMINNQDLNPELMKHKPKAQLIVDIKYTVTFIFNVLIKYIDKYKLGLDVRLVELQTEFISMNLVEPYIMNHHLFEYKKHKLTKIMNDLKDDLGIILTPDFVEVLHYLNQLTQDVSA